MISPATFNYVQELLSEMEDYEQGFSIDLFNRDLHKERNRTLDTNWNKAYEQIPDGLLRHDFQD
jgi:hypothetical protein